MENENAKTMAASGQAQLSSRLISRASLTEGSISKALLGMALPMAVGIFATMSFNMADTYFVSVLGDDALAALSFTFPVVMMAISLSVGLGAGTSSVVSRAAGENDEQAVRELITDSMILTLVMALVFAILGYLTIDPLFSALGANADILPLVREYMVLWYVGIPFLVAPMVGMAAIRALGNTRLQAQLMIAMAIANAVLDPFFIFGWWIFPRMEIEGAALASLVVRVASLVVALYIMHWKMQLFVGSIHFNRLWQSWKKILHVGIPAMATNMIIPASGAVLIALVATHGSEAVAGFGVATRIESMALIFFYALSAVIGPFCGQNLGAGRYDRLYGSQRLSAIFCFLIGAIITVLMLVSGRWIAGFFSDDVQVINTTYLYLVIVPISYCTYGVVMAVNASFNGLGKPFPGVVISAARVIFVLLPLAWLGNYLVGVWGIFVAVAVSNIGVGIGAYFWIRNAIGKTERRSQAAQPG